MSRQTFSRKPPAVSALLVLGFVATSFLQLSESRMREDERPLQDLPSNRRYMLAPVIPSLFGSSSDSTPRLSDLFSNNGGSAMSMPGLLRLPGSNKVTATAASNLREEDAFGIKSISQVSPENGVPSSAVQNGNGFTAGAAYSSKDMSSPMMLGSGFWKTYKMYDHGAEDEQSAQPAPFYPGTPGSPTFTEFFPYQNPKYTEAATNSTAQIYNFIYGTLYQCYQRGLSPSETAAAIKEEQKVSPSVTDHNNACRCIRNFI